MLTYTYICIHNLNTINYENTHMYIYEFIYAYIYTLTYLQICKHAYIYIHKLPPKRPSAYPKIWTFQIIKILSYIYTYIYMQT